MQFFVTYTLALAVAGGLVSAIPLEKRTPPNIPSASAATQMLSQISVRTRDATGYKRSEFPHWIDVQGCTTRETVLARDGTDIVVNPTTCAPRGTWYSPYDGAEWTNPADLDIDHVVPLSEAWKSGANTWTLAQRRTFANDLMTPQLIAVTDNVNQAKGDSRPDVWRPPLSSFWCEYARMWVAVKYAWVLTVRSDERQALVDMLATCP